ncbi:mycofactocin system protein MftB [Pseudoclavibacter endophyticus]|uniref:Mycofactocin biosynthesis chaperone MftB n=1 Tax=Pseudoclavibacter endophyticus TaxID=1778590 RepID=A0A6H9WPI8_9MICO|nr:mycofactocin biosynthesis chaperone MftB [Pseudoclavibacter endophyticus]KAB1649661.1 mycofactocin biosynthesis chaperone MftB [Pseudoclavibacter endophyticus]GGA60834.1 mycofactocin system protein MftB [Pseudoclavibacter endophyticus]
MSEFDADRPWQVHPRVAIRPERFGALLYHFETRKLSFLKERALLSIVDSLDSHASMREAVVAAGIAPPEQGKYLAALSGLAASNMIRERAA